MDIHKREGIKYKKENKICQFCGCKAEEKMEKIDGHLFRRTGLYVCPLCGLVYSDLGV